MKFYSEISAILILPVVIDAETKEEATTALYDLYPSQEALTDIIVGGELIDLRRRSVSDKPIRPIHSWTHPKIIHADDLKLEEEEDAE